MSQALRRIRELEMENEVLRQRICRRPTSRPQMIYPLVKEMAALGARVRVPRSATLLGAVLETLVWSGAAGLAALSWGVIQAGANPALIQMAAPIAASGTAGALATTLLVVPLLMRRDVDHYQRHAGT